MSNKLDSEVFKEKKIKPADLYLEGNDQFRGWFNSSLIIGTILDNQAPYKQVISHGFVVDAQGQKMSKSLGNVIDPEELIEKYGADILRLWTSSTDFTKEVRFSVSTLEVIKESYQKIRNTLRFLLANLYNLPELVKSESDLEKDLELVDDWILDKLNKLSQSNQNNYANYNFNIVYRDTLNFCVNDLSSFYFEISKDSLYCDKLDSLRRKQIVTVCYYLLGSLLKIIAPILPFLAEEIYQKIPFNFGYSQKKSIMLASFENRKNKELGNIGIISDFFKLRQEIFLALEKARQKKVIHTSSQGEVKVWLKTNRQKKFANLDLRKLLPVAGIRIMETKENLNFNQDNTYQGELSYIEIEKTSKGRCLRCWNYENLNQQLCSRCCLAM